MVKTTFKTMFETTITSLVRSQIGLVAGLCCAIALPALGDGLNIHYTVSPVPATASESAVTHVSVQVSGLNANEAIKLQMAVWSPGDYHVQNHNKYVQSVRSKDDSAVKRVDDTTWEVTANQDGAVEVLYNLPNERPGFFSDNVTVRSKYAFYNGPATYMYVVGHKQDPTEISFNLPEGWSKTFMPLEGKADAKNTYLAPDFDTLADSPAVAGNFETREFTSADKPHTIVFFNQYEGANFNNFVAALKPIVDEETRLMGGAPYKRYGFFIDMNGDGGGLEHLNSNRIAFPNSAPASFAASMEAHEFFHCWNVKRIRPDVLGPFDYINPPKTHNLWFSEGVTSYYGDISLHRSGTINATQYLEGLGQTISNFRRNPNRLKVSAEESSYRVWEAGNSSGYGGLSYYEKGEIIGLCLDLKLRKLTGNKVSLDTVMRDMMAKYGLPKPGFPEDGIRTTLTRLQGPESALFYDLLTKSTQEVPLEEVLSYVGLRLLDTMQGRLRLLSVESPTPEQIRLRHDWLVGNTSR